MKIRKGFVSNSSSTSFCIYGVLVDKTIERELYKNKKETFLEFFRGNPNSDDLCYLGLSYTEINMDETKRQFQNKIEEEIKRLDIKCSDFDTYEESYYNG